MNSIIGFSVKLLKLRVLCCLCCLINLKFTYAALKVVSPLPSLTEADIGSEVILSCNVSGEPRPKIFWLRNGRTLPSQNLTWEYPNRKKNVLVSGAVLPGDSGNYTCLASNLYDFIRLDTKLLVKTPPAKLQNVSVHPSTILATVRWHVENDGGYPITNFTLLYRPAGTNESTWHFPQLHISPASRQLFVYLLKPGTKYTFKMWANNKLGSGEPVSVQATTSKQIDPPELLGKILIDAENIGSTTWLAAICMVAATVLLLSLLSCALIYRETGNFPHEENLPRIIANPGFEIDLEQSYLLDHADYNDNTEQTFRMNNNTVIQPSRV
ncbi:neural cell adhesion molecule 1-A-like [Uloborus diversus]|uniref:neural cell adhesion molecule 1-A-like n=1 Tax=Uloborus diversus TaxID=327109 RepID=UPI0024093AEF|nr:neural cell adhesion molecule 1-A-like [Uloborus diversus]